MRSALKNLKAKGNEMDLGKFKVGDLNVAIRLDGSDMVLEERYPILKPLQELVDMLEKAIPGDQLAQAELLKALIQAKFSA